MTVPIRGRSIRMFLSDGTPTGLIIAEIVNWTGKALVVPRAALAAFVKRKEAQNAGVYILAGSDPNDPFRPTLYVGQSETVGRRLLEHDNDPKRDFFDRAIIFVSKDENLTNAHARHLEHHLTDRIKKAGRTKPTNLNKPGGAALPEADVADMEYFLDQIEIVLPVLGLDVLRPIATLAIESIAGGGSAVAPQFELNIGQAAATAVEINGDFIVKAGSIARDAEAPTIPSAYKSIRNQLKADGSLAQGENQTLIFKQDVPFKSPSAAASVVYGASMSGPANWLLSSTKQTYAEYRQKALLAAEAQGEKLAGSNAVEE